MTLQAPAVKVINRRAPKGGLAASPALGIKPQKGGQFIPQDVWMGERRRAENALPDVMQSASKRMAFLADAYQAALALAGRKPVRGERGVPIAFTPARVQEELREQVRATIEQAFLLGKRAGGSLFALTDAEEARINTLTGQQHPFLAGFLAAMKAGSGQMDYGERAALYGRVAQGAFWEGVLSANPQARYTWRLGEAVHCKSCLDMSKRGAMTAAELAATGLVPQSVKLACTGLNCKCWLEEQG